MPDTHDPLTRPERQTLLRLARQAIASRVHRQVPPPIAADDLTERLRAPGATFITLTIAGELRGCIGTLEARRPLVEDVQEHAIGAAFEDPRFPPLRSNELDRIQIEISRLTAPVRLEYRDAAELLTRLRPHVDGVILRDGLRRATFLPQVWEKLPDPAEFLSYLCNKLGTEAQAWRTRHLEVLVYQVEEFHEQSEL